MPINRVKYVVADGKATYRNDPIAILNETSFILDLYDKLLTRSCGHRRMAVTKRPFGYDEKPMDKDQGRKNVSVSIFKDIKRGIPSLAEGELMRIPKTTTSTSTATTTAATSISTFGEDFDRPVSANSLRQQYAKGLGGGTEFYMLDRLAFSAAAIMIQSVWRMHRTRTRIRAALDDPIWSAQNTDQEALQSHYSTGSNGMPLAVEFMFGDRIQEKFRDYYERIGHRVNVNMTYFDFGAVVIQRNYRVFRARRLVQKKREEVARLKAEQELLKEDIKNDDEKGAKQVEDEEDGGMDDDDDGDDENAFARIIQNAWHKYCYRETFKFIKNLIFGFHMNGNPKRLLSFINPKESEYMDNAAGLHLRFRLGGEKFPPQLYYRIYTHRPLVDMNAFSPRPNYSILKGLENGQPVHVKNTGTAASDLKNTLQMLQQEGWYSRPETNEWRLVSMNVLDPFYPSAMIKFQMQRHLHPVSARTQPFHYSNLVRRQDLQIQKKGRRRDWFRKMYKMGMATENPPTSQDIQNLESIHDSDLDYLIDDMEGIENAELLKWVTQLDYKDYFHHWFMIGSSGFTDMKSSLRMPEEIRRVETDQEDLRPRRQQDEDTVPARSVREPFNIEMTSPAPAPVMSSQVPRDSEDIIQIKTMNWENLFSSRK